jgi:cytosine/uracil/thiamine/allantoin permease
MNTRKMGKFFIVLMISLIAFGCGSCANALNAGNDITNGMIPSSINWNNQEQITIISDSSFDPVHVMRHFYNNTTNSTNTTNVINNTVSNSTRTTANTTRNN